MNKKTAFSVSKSTDFVLLFAFTPKKKRDIILKEKGVNQVRTVEIADFMEMENVNLTKIFAMNQVWREGFQFVMKNPRATSAILWFFSCSGIFRTAEGDVIEAPRGSVVYIPEGARYTLEFLSCNGFPSTVLAEFRLTDGEAFALAGGIRIMEAEADDTRICSLLKKLVFEYSLPSKPMLKLRRDVYGLLALLGESEKYKHIDRRGFQTVKRGIEYLQKDEKQALSIDEIAKMCFVSPAYFRKLFKEYAGVSPSEYRIQRKIEHAKELMEHSALSIGELAHALGYDDPAYFCRVFKKETGISPSEYQKSTKERQTKESSYGKDTSLGME